MIEQAMDTFGAIDIVVNNAGNLRDVIFHKMTEDDWDSVIGVHLKGSFNTANAAAPPVLSDGEQFYQSDDKSWDVVLPKGWTVAPGDPRRNSRRRRALRSDRADRARDV